MPTQNSKLVEVVTVANVDDEDQIWELRFGHKALFQTLSTRFGQEFKVEAQARF